MPSSLVAEEMQGRNQAGMATTPANKDGWKTEA